jgi:hypothetical protein
MAVFLTHSEGIQVMDEATKRIVDALRDGAAARLENVPHDRRDDALVNIKATDLLIVIGALDAAK